MLERQVNERQKLSEKEQMLAAQQGLDQQEIQMKAQKDVMMLQMEASRLAKQQDVNTLFALEKLKTEDKVKTIKALSDAREKMLNSEKDTDS